MTRLKGLLWALILTLCAAPAVRAQDEEDQDLKAKRAIRDRILRKVEERLQSEMKRIHDEVAKLLDEELGLAPKEGEKPGPAADTRRQEIRKRLDAARKAAEAKGKEARKVFDEAIEQVRAALDEAVENREQLERKIEEARATIEKRILEAKAILDKAFGTGDKADEEVAQARAAAEKRIAEARQAIDKAVAEAKTRIEEHFAARKRPGEARTGQPGKATPGHKPETPAVDRPAWMGVQLGGHEEEEEAKGVPIAHVMPGSPAEQAGLKDADVVLKIGKEEVNDPQALIELVSAHKAGDKVELTLQRGDQEKKITVTLGARPAEMDTGNEPEDEGEATEEKPQPPVKPVHPKAGEQPKPEEHPTAAEHPAGGHPAVEHGIGPVVIGFDRLQPGAVPESFETAMTGKGAPAKWEVQADPTAPSAPNVVAQTSTDETDYRFPILVMKGHGFADVEVGVKFKPVSGKVDQAAGLVFRYQDANNYYLTRANALEENLRLYKVVDGKRRQFAGVNAKCAAGTWHDLRVVAKGDEIQVSLDGKLQITAKDSTFDKGLVGLWTKADSVTHFDDLSVHSIAGAAPGETKKPETQEPVAKPPEAKKPEPGTVAPKKEPKEEEGEDEGDEAAAKLQEGFDQAMELHTSGKYAEAVAGFKKVAEAGKGGPLGVTAAYNVACGLARLKKLDEAFEWLEKAVDQGFVRPEEIRKDEDFENLRKDPRFEKVIQKAQELRAKGVNPDEGEEEEEIDQPKGK